MKKYLILLAAAITLLACGKKAGQQNEEVPALDSTIIVEYQVLTDSLTALFNDESIDEATGEAILSGILARYLDLAEAAPQTDMCYEILRNTYYYYSTDEKARLFATMDADTIEARGLGKYLHAFLAEQQTSVGCQYINFGAPGVNSEWIELKDLVDGEHWVLVDFWASWCGPCRRAMPAMKELKEITGNHLIILGVSLDSDKLEWQKAIRRMRLDWKHVSDLKGWASEPAALYGVCSIPATVLIAPDGTIRGRNMDIAEMSDIILTSEL